MINKRLGVLLLTLLYCQTKTDQAVRLSDNKPKVIHNTSSNEKFHLFREQSWRVYSTFLHDGSIYTCLPRLYEDKVTFLEQSTKGGLNYLFKFFGDIIPPQWNINTGKTTVWNLDPFDAIDLGIQDANPKIVQSCLEILPISKASALSGLSTEWREKVNAEGKFDITQKLTLNMESLTGKINRHRLIKGISFTAGLLSYFGLANNNVLDEKKQLYDDGFATAEFKSFGTLKPVTVALATLTALISEYTESQHINNHVEVYELLINSDKVFFNKEQVKSQLKKLHNKIRRFKLHKTAGDKLQTLIEKL